jgi:hypothetical protein
MTAFLPDQPQCTPRDPLRVFLLGPATEVRPQSPPWIRIFRIGGAMPWNVDWRHYPLPCDGCGIHVTFQAQAYPRPNVIAYCLLCLACGRATVEHLRPGTTLREMPIVGERWSPPDVGVARLREAVFRPLWRNQWHAETG